jgi:seryl-tRNA synthetase
MYDIKWIREHPEAFDKGLARRGLTPSNQQSFSDRLISIDSRRRTLIRLLESFQADRNSASKLIGEAKKKNDEKLVAELMAKVALAKESIPRLEKEEKEAEEQLRKELSELPNFPLDEVPDGTDASGNVERPDDPKSPPPKKRNYTFKPKEHFELGEALGMMDFELAAKLSGARFVVLQKGLARLERALGQFFLDVHTEKHGYTEVNPPLLVRSDTMFGTAQLPKFKDDQFVALTIEIEMEARRLALAEFDRGELADKDINHRAGEIMNRLWLIPTAEVPLTNLVRESIVDEDSLPRRYTACTPCFRAEAGAAGKDTRGMIRQHQFTKVELVSIVKPENSKEEHERMLACAEEVLKKLDLHYRVVTLCTGDMGFAAQKTYDIEVWLPGQNMFREISSCSNCGEFQARRMHPPGKPNEGTRYRGADGKIKGFVHTLNGSGVAVGRALIAVMETYQQEDGSIEVPEALKRYMGETKKIERA